MDKNEYNLRLAEIEQYVDQGDYAAAAKDADTIEWKRVRNVRTLCMVSEIYEAVGRYDDSKKLLLRAYKRSPVGRTILYRLVEVTIHLKQFDEAIEYYSEYVQAAPHDNNKYILKYEIYRGRGSSIDEQIEILKEFQSHEYNEKYAYELARLYRDADRIDECLTACDDLVLWFHSGKYVIKALELKKEYRPLTPKQQEIYDHRFDEEPEEMGLSYEEEPAEIGQEKKIVEAPETSQTQAILDDTVREIAQEIAAAKREEEGTAEVQAASVEAEELSSPVQAEAEDVQENAEAAAETETAPAEEEPEAQPEPPVSPEVLASRVAQSMRQITSGIGMRMTQDPDKEAADEVIEESKRDQEAVMAARAAAGNAGDALFGAPVTPIAPAATEAAPARSEDVQRPRGLKLPEFGKKSAAPKRLTIDDVLLSMGERGEAVREAAAKANTVEKKQPEGVLSAVDEALLNMGAKTEEPEAQTADALETAQDAVEVQAEAAEAAVEEAEQELAKTADEAIADAKETAETSAKEALSDLSEEAAVNAEPVLNPELSREAEAVKEAGRELAAAFAREPKPAKTETKSVEDMFAETFADTAKELFGDDEEEAEEAAAEETAAEEVVAEAIEETAAEVKEAVEEKAEEQDDILTAKTRVIPTEEIARLYGKTPIVMPEEKAEPAENIEQAPDKIVGEVPVKETETDDKTVEFATDTDLKHDVDLDPVDLDEEEEEAEEVQEEKAEEPAKEPEAPRRRLAPQLRGLFDGFLEIDHLEDQIAYAIDQALAKNGERTSKSGNIVIFGGHGCGKTTIAVGIAKAIAQVRGDKAVKMAKIYATDLNRKDIPKTIAKIAGGILIVEEAGDLDDGIADQLTTAMEFRTDGMIMILEDEQKYIRELLNRHPRFTMKFTSQIYIPIFTPDELVAFAQDHAQEQGYVLHDSAIDVLADRIEKLGAEGETVSIISMNELVDNAIVRANKFGRKMFSGKNRYDERGRVVLIDKDFR